MTVNGINYCDTFFEFPDLTKIHFAGEPDSESLYKIRNELRANAKSVYSNLSDGAHGHLALVMTATQYTLVSNMAFVCPVHPGTLLIPPATTGPQAQVLREHHKEQLRLFQEVEGVEKALIQQIIESVEAPYLAAIRDRVSNSLTGTVQQILDNLQTSYGQISPQMLEDHKQELRNLSYNPRLPIDVVFNAVEDCIVSWGITDSYSLIFVASLRTLSSTLSHQTSITLLIVSHSILILSAPPYYIF